MATKKKTEVKMTPEILAKLRGVSVVTDTVDYVHEIADVPEEFHPKFTLKAFTVEDAKKFRATKAKDDELDELFEEIVRSHLVDWTENCASEALVCPTYVLGTRVQGSGQAAPDHRGLGPHRSLRQDPRGHRGVRRDEGREEEDR